MIPSGVKVFHASHPIDFGKGPDSLFSLARDAGNDPCNGALCVFGQESGPDQDRVVGWFWRLPVCEAAGESPVLLARIGRHRVQLNHAQLLALVDGMDWKRVRTTPVKPPEIVG